MCGHQEFDPCRLIAFMLLSSYQRVDQVLRKVSLQASQLPRLVCQWDPLVGLGTQPGSEAIDQRPCLGFGQLLEPLSGDFQDREVRRLDLWSSRQHRYRCPKHGPQDPATLLIRGETPNRVGDLCVASGEPLDQEVADRIALLS